MFNYKRILLINQTAFTTRINCSGSNGQKIKCSRTFMILFEKGNSNAFWVTCLTRKVPECFCIAILRNNPLVRLEEFLYYHCKQPQHSLVTAPSYASLGRPFQCFLMFSSSSSSSIGCGAGGHKVSPCTTIISKCGNLLFLH